MAKFKCPYTYPHRSREAMIDYILSNGGYHANRESWPLAYNVKAYPNLEYGHLWKKHADEHLPKNLTPAMRSACHDIAVVEHENSKAHLWDWAIEDARSNVTDCDTYAMLWDGKDRIKATEFGFCGRSGGYIAVMRFHYTDFRGWSQDTFEEHLRAESMKELRLLYKMCRQWEVDWNPAKAREEVEYHAAWRLFTSCESEWAAVVETSMGPKLEGRRIRIRSTGGV